MNKLVSFAERNYIYCQCWSSQHHCRWSPESPLGFLIKTLGQSSPRVLPERRHFEMPLMLTVNSSSHIISNNRLSGRMTLDECRITNRWSCPLTTTGSLNLAFSCCHAASAAAANATFFSARQNHQGPSVPVGQTLQFTGLSGHHSSNTEAGPPVCQDPVQMPEMERSLLKYPAASHAATLCWHK